MTFNISTISCDSVSAIAMVAAVIVALFYPAWRERGRLKIHGSIYDFVPEGPKQPVIMINLTNYGVKPINLIRWGGMFRKKYRKEKGRKAF